MKKRKILLSAVFFVFIVLVFIILMIHKRTPEYQILKKHKDELKKISREYYVSRDDEKLCLSIGIQSSMSYELGNDMIKLSKELYNDYLFDDESPFKDWKIDIFICHFTDEIEESNQIIADRNEVEKVIICTNIVDIIKVADEFPDVSYLSVSNCKVTSEQLSSFRSIQKLSLEKNCISEEEIDKFKEIYPDCDISVDNFAN